MECEPRVGKGLTWYLPVGRTILSLTVWTPELFLYYPQSGRDSYVQDDYYHLLPWDDIMPAKSNYYRSGRPHWGKCVISIRLLKIPTVTLRPDKCRKP